MLFRIFQYFGISLIVAFCALSILLSTSERDLSSSGDKSFLITYASFFEDRFFDLRMRFTIDPHKKDNRMVLAAIDDHSLNKIGRWPWTRTKHAQIIDKLGSFGAKIIAFDVFYSEPEVACNAESPDNVLASSIKNFQSTPGHKIILPYSVDIKETNVVDEENYFKEVPDQLLNFVLDTKQAQGANLQPNLVGKKVYPIPILANSDVGISHIEAQTDSDGVFRHYPLVTNIDSIYFPSFALQAYQFYTDDKPSLEIPSSESAFLKTKKGISYLNYNGESKVRWLGGLDHFPMVPIYDIFNAKDGDARMTNIFKDKIVFVAS
ncbi:MAG: CHASE2 domain-containing protein, partial [Bacteriovorax sp.]